MYGLTRMVQLQVLWPKVGRSSKDPDLICSHFLASVMAIGHVPRMVRLDRGTENVHISKAQQILRADHEDSLSSYCAMYGASTHNQRIECFWWYLKRFFLQDYMDLFKDYITSGVVDTSSPSHMELLAFCFMPAICAELTAHMAM